MTSKTSILAPPYHVQNTGIQLRSGFPYFPWHESVSALWTQRWRVPCDHGIYPFTDAKVEDFDQVFADLIKISDDRPDILNQPDTYAATFFPVAEKLQERAQEAETAGYTEKARDLYLRAAAVYRIARFPINRSPKTQEAWERGKTAYLEGGRYLDTPVVPLDIAFSHADVAAGDTAADIQTYLRMPKGVKPATGWPVVLFICGLDAYKTDHTPRTQEHVDRGCVVISFEIPGNGDCPAAPNDPDSPDRIMSSVLDWVEQHSAERGFDKTRICARGISTGGYYAMRCAHTHADRLFAVVAQGGGCHHMFDAEWIRHQNQMEYPYALADALAYKFGYRGPDAFEAYTREASKFSLLNAGILDKPSCKLLLIDGMEDSIFPIEDNFIVAARGRKKDLIVRGDRGHMGNPGAEQILYAWIDDVLAGKP